MNLVIVESPAKAKTIEGYLGKDYKVIASYGHIRDLPKSKIGIAAKTLEPEYIIPVKSRKQVTLLKKETKSAKKIILATDEDREGEAIAWHILYALDIKNDKDQIQNTKTYERIVFHEITKEAIFEAVQKPRSINQNMVDAQQARRVLDRLVGYNLSPLLWKKIRRGLSAGRVQSVALRLIVEREREIEAFKQDEYWEIITHLIAPNQEGSKIFEAKLIKINNEKIKITNEKEATAIIEYLNKQKFIVNEIVRSEKKNNPNPPFMTSTLQQEAAQKLRFSTKQTMMVAQKLYEGIKIPMEGPVGLITYMRTDSTTLSNQAILESREYIKTKFGQNYLPDKPIYYKAKKGAQEAHEAIRPTKIERTPESLVGILEEEQLKLYRLIWQRTIASQMNSEILDLLRVDIKAGNHVLRANGRQVKFDGFSKIYFAKTKTDGMKTNKEIILPAMLKGDECLQQKIEPLQKFTQPPARYTEASLVKTLEENGIGRPSTYAPTISTLKDRRYVISEKRYLTPQEIGFVVNDMLVKHFPEIVDIQFTAKIESELDEIATGKIDWKKPVKEFWIPFLKKIKDKEKEIEKPPIIDPDIAAAPRCEKCSKSMVLKEGRFGKFYACTGFPDCKNTKPYLEKIGQKCPDCNQGDVIIKRTRGGRTFWGCSRYPDCKWASWTPPKAKEN